MTDLLCSEGSQLAWEQLFGSAKHVQVYFLLEFDGRWEPEAFRDSLIPEPIRSFLQTALDTIPQSHILLIRQQPRLITEGTAFFVVLARESDPVIYEFHLSGAADLLALDIPAVVSESPVYAAQRRAEPLFLVCTHGRRDKCCARHGVPVYEYAALYAGPALWQSSHVGGHRFAANMTVLPHGILYGRVRPDSTAAIIDATRAGNMLPEHYRGRACYGKVAQAAEYFLRAETGITALDAFQLAGVESAGDHQWSARFGSAENGAAYTLLLAEESIQVLASCGDTVPETFSQYRLLTLESAQP